MIRRIHSKRVLTVVALLCLQVAFLSAQVHIREKIQIQPTSPRITQADVNAGDNLRFVFEWTPDRILGRMFVTGLDNDFNVVVDTFLTDVGGHLEVISPAVEGEYSFNLQIRTAELLPGEEETLKLSIYLNETLLREDTDFSYSFTGVFSVWIPESFIYFADPLHHFSIQLNPFPMSYGESSVLTIIARDASNSEIPFAGTKTLTLRVVPDDFMSFITTAGDTVGPEMTGVPYSAARGETIRIIGNGLIPYPGIIGASVSAELEENTSKNGALDVQIGVPCVETIFSPAVAQTGDTVSMHLVYEKSDGTMGSFLPGQQFTAEILSEGEVGVLFSEDGQSGTFLDGVNQPLNYLPPDSIAVDSLVVQFMVAPTISGGAAVAAPSGEPSFSTTGNDSYSQGNAIAARSQIRLLLSESACEIPQLIVRNPPGPVLEIETSSGDQEISSIPKMPEVTFRARLKDYVEGTVNFFWNITVEWTGKGSWKTPNNPEVYQGSKSGQNSDWIDFDVKTNSDWVALIRGGQTVKISVRATAGSQVFEKVLENPFRILGRNPSKSDMLTELNERVYKAIAYKESRLNQFAKTLGVLANPSPDFPLQGVDPNDVGIMQINNPENDDIIWNWKSNIGTGKARYIDKLGKANNYGSRVRSGNTWYLNDSTYYFNDPIRVTSVYPRGYLNATDLTGDDLAKEAIQRYNKGIYWRWVPIEPDDPESEGAWRASPRNDYGDTVWGYYQNQPWN